MRRREFIFTNACRARYLIIFTVLFSSCSRNEKQIEKLNWLIGNWEIIAPQGQLYEVWTKKNDSVFSGRTHMIMNNDTVFSETLSIEQKKDGLYYFPAAYNEKDGKPAYLKLIKNNEGEFVFENLQLDFPRRIIYKNTRPDSLYARIEGLDSGEYRKEEFRMIRKTN
jgi:hypothetical protein